MWEGLTFHIRKRPCCHGWREATNVWKCWSRNELRWAKVTWLWPWHVPSFGELGFKIGPLFFRVTNIHFQLQSNTKVLSLAKPPSWIEVKKNISTQRKRRPTLKPSSPKLSICQGQIAFTLVYWTSFQNQLFQTFVLCLWCPCERCYRSSHKGFIEMLPPRFGREGIIVHECTSHWSNIKTWAL